MIRFPKQPWVDQAWDALERKWRYRLLEVFVYEWEEDGVLRALQVPQGFMYDGGSIPRWALSLIGLTPGGQILAAATVHDFLYRYDGKPPEGSYLVLYEGTWKRAEDTFTRKEADQLFLEIMNKTEGIRRTQELLAYWSVRIGARRW